MHFNRESAAELLARGGFFWPDLDRPDSDAFDTVREVFGFHPPAVEDSEHFEQRAKLEDYDDFIFIVVYGASPDEDRWSRCTASTPSASSSPSTGTTAPRSPRGAGATGNATRRSTVPRCCSIIDGPVDSFFPILADFDDRIDELENAIFLPAGEEQLQEIFRMKRLLVGMRKAVKPSARRIRERGRRNRRAARTSGGGRTLLPRHL
jgi:magnesium transporter